MKLEDKSKLELIGEIAEANNKNLELIEIINNLEERIDKTIEYIENNSYKTEWGDLEQDNESINVNDDITETEFIENLLEILKGE